MSYRPTRLGESWFWLTGLVLGMGLTAAIVFGLNQWTRSAPAGRIVVVTGSLAVPRGDTVTLAGYLELLPGTVPPEVLLETRGAHGLFRQEMLGDPTLAYTLTLEPAEQSFEYRMVAGHLASPWYAVQVVERLTLERLELTLTPPPGYEASRLARKLSQVEPLQALPGSELTISLSVREPIDSVQVKEPYQAAHVELSEDRRHVLIRGTITHERDWTIHLTGSEHRQASWVIPMRLKHDEPPVWTKCTGLTRGEYQATVTDRIDAEIQIEDDYGIKSIYWELQVLSAGEKPRRVEIPITLAARAACTLSQSLSLRLSDHVRLGDSVRLRLVAQDTRSGPLGPGISTFPQDSAVVLSIVGEAPALCWQMARKEQSERQIRGNEFLARWTNWEDQLKHLQEDHPDTETLTPERRILLLEAQESIHRFGLSIQEYLEYHDHHPHREEFIQALATELYPELRALKGEWRTLLEGKSLQIRQAAFERCQYHARNLSRKIWLLRAVDQELSDLTTAYLVSKSLAASLQELANDAQLPEARQADLIVRATLLQQKFTTFSTQLSTLEFAQHRAQRIRLSESQELVKSLRQAYAAAYAEPQARTRLLADQQRALLESLEQYQREHSAALASVRVRMPIVSNVTRMIEEGQLFPAMTEQEKIAAELERVAQVLGAAVRDQIDLRVVVKQHQHWHDDLLRRIADAPPAERAELAREHQRLARSLSSRQFCSDAFAQLTRQFESLSADYAKLLTDDPAQARERTPQLIQLLEQALEAVPSLPIRKSRSLTMLKVLARQQELMQLQVLDLAKLPPEAIVNKVMPHVEQHEMMARQLNALDLPIDEGLRRKLIQAVLEARNDLRNLRRDDFRASQWRLRRILERAQKVLLGIPTETDSANRLAEMVRRFASSFETPHRSGEYITLLRGKFKEIKQELNKIESDFPLHTALQIRDLVLLIDQRLSTPGNSAPMNPLLEEIARLLTSHSPEMLSEDRLSALASGLALLGRLPPRLTPESARLALVQHRIHLSRVIQELELVRLGEVPLSAGPLLAHLKVMTSPASPADAVLLWNQLEELLCQYSHAWSPMPQEFTGPPDVSQEHLARERSLPDRLHREEIREFVTKQRELMDQCAQLQLEKPRDSGLSAAVAQRLDALSTSLESGGLTADNSMSLIAQVLEVKTRMTRRVRPEQVEAQLVAIEQSLMVLRLSHQGKNTFCSIDPIGRALLDLPQDFRRADTALRGSLDAGRSRLSALAGQMTRLTDLLRTALSQPIPARPCGPRQSP